MTRMDGIKIKFYGNSSWLKDSGYSIEEQGDIYDDLLEDIINNPRWYLDQLPYLPEFKVDWINYAKQNVTRPYKFVKQINKDNK